MQPRWWDRALGWHVAAAQAAPARPRPLARPGVATIDEGAYGIQAPGRRGSWAYPEGLAASTRTGGTSRSTRALRAGGRRVVRLHQAPGGPGADGRDPRGGGESAGLVVLPLLGALAAATVAGGSRPSGTDAGRPWRSGWSPAARSRYAYVAWATRWPPRWPARRVLGDGPDRPPRPRRSGASPRSLTLAGGALVRSEGVLVAVAVLVVLAVLLDGHGAQVRRSRRRRLQCSHTPVAWKPWCGGADRRRGRSP